MKRLKILVLLCSLLSFLYCSDEYHEHEKHHIYKNLDYLNLSPTQYEKIKEILIEYKNKYNHFYEKKEKKQLKLQKLIIKDEFDKEKYEKISEEIFKKAIKLEIKTLDKIHKILDKNQRKRFSYYLKEWQVE